MRVHLIALGGSIMHQLAIELQQNGHIVSGSDDEIFEPARSNLLQAGLLPEYSGWAPERITQDLDLIILGMHAHADNPELQRALETGIPVLSFPAFVARFSQNKQRIVIAGSHGKTTTTSMIMHAFQEAEMDYDYLVGAKLEGFSRMVKLTMEAPIMVLEGDEYLSSALDPNPKFLHYDPDILVLTGIAWDHMNVFPTFNAYQQAFRRLLAGLKKGAKVVWFQDDPVLAALVSEQVSPHASFPYREMEATWQDNVLWLTAGQQAIKPLSVFGGHNLQNLAAAREVCRLSGIPSDIFFEAASTFQGASRRLEVIGDGPKGAIYQDFAHAPSKVRATVRAIREKYPNRKIVACLELHTYSSLNPAFLPQYAGSMDGIDAGMVFFSEETLKNKRLPSLNAEAIKEYFNNPHLDTCNQLVELHSWLEAQRESNVILLLMSSGRFQGLNIRQVTEKYMGLKE